MRIIEITLYVGMSAGKIQTIKELREAFRTENTVPSLTRTKDLFERAQSSDGVQLRITAEQFGNLTMCEREGSPAFWTGSARYIENVQPVYVDFTDGGVALPGTFGQMG